VFFVRQLVRFIINVRRGRPHGPQIRFVTLCWYWKFCSPKKPSCSQLFVSRMVSSNRSNKIGISTRPSHFYGRRFQANFNYDNQRQTTFRAHISVFLKNRKINLFRKFVFPLPPRTDDRYVGYRVLATRRHFETVSFCAVRIYFRRA